MSAERSVITFKSPRARDLANFATEEIDHYKTGQVQILKSNQELAAMFDYPYKTSVPRILRWANLLEERTRIFQETEGIKLTPSRELAWMIGVLAGGGNVSGRGRRVEITTPDRDLLIAAKSTGEDLFETNGLDKGKSVKFNNSKLPEYLGDLRRPNWASTIKEKHQWIMSQPEYTWGLLEGLFDTIGGIIINTGRKSRTMIGFNTSYAIPASFLSEMLVMVGAKNPRIDRDTTNPDGIKRVAVYNLADAQLIAQNIHSHVLEKEEQLEYLRRFVIRRKLPIKISSPEDLVREWVKIKRLINHPPTTTDIKRLRLEGQTNFGPEAYIERFSKKPGVRSFKEARRNLEGIIFEREVNSALRGYAKEIRYTPKTHPVHDEVAEERLRIILEEITEAEKQSLELTTLVDHRGAILSA